MFCFGYGTMSTESAPKPCCSWQVGTRMLGISRSSSLSRLMTANALSQPPSFTSRALTGDGWVMVPATFLTSHSRSASSAAPYRISRSIAAATAGPSAPSRIRFSSSLRNIGSSMRPRGSSLVSQVLSQPLAQPADVDIVHAAGSAAPVRSPACREVKRVRRGRAHRRARPHYPHAGQRGRVAVHAPAGRHQVVRALRGHRPQRHVVHVVGVEHLPDVAVRPVVQLDRPGSPRHRVIEPGPGADFGNTKLVDALDPAGLPAPGKPVGPHPGLA